MRRALVTIFTIAILGSLSVYAKGNHSTVATTSVKSSNTTASTTQAPSNIASSSSSYKDGTYTGSSNETAYGTVQVAVVISGGKITDINFLQMPSDLQHSQEVTAVSGPILKQETLSAQSASIDFVSGATSTSFGYEQSLQAALDQAKLS